MKNLSLLLILLVFISSCETEFSNTYVIKNTTTHQIKIAAYDRIGFDSVLVDPQTMYLEKFSIEPNSDFKKIKAAGYHMQIQSIFESYDLDSLSIIFDSSRIITFACNQPSGSNCTGKYNLMNHEENYEKDKTGKASGKDEFTYTYTFTEADFESALIMK